MISRLGLGLEATPPDRVEMTLNSSNVTSVKTSAPTDLPVADDLIHNHQQQQQQQQQQRLPDAVTKVPDEVVRNFTHTKRVGNYFLGRTVGEGSFAKVKEGLHIITGEQVAVKVIDKKKAKDDPYVRRNMRRESRLLQQIRHHNIVQLFEVMETENSYYLVTELCGGGDLMSRICGRKRLDETETRRYIRQIVSAVDYLHKAGIIHRDLKVENLLLDENKDIKIIDFGLSNFIRPSDNEDGEGGVLRGKTGRGNCKVNNCGVGEGGNGGMAPELCVTQCGSPAYAAPELLNNSKYGPQVDIWSIGVNMFAMLTGNLPFTVEPFTIKALYNKMINGEMNSLPEHLTTNCRDLLKQFLTADPSKRITLQQAMQHAWLAGNRNKPMSPAAFPNRLRTLDLSQMILVYMVQELDFKLGDVIKLVTTNSPSSASATYHLLLRRVNTYRLLQRHLASDVYIPGFSSDVTTSRGKASPRVTIATTSPSGRKRAVRRSYESRRQQKRGDLEVESRSSSTVNIGEYDDVINNVNNNVYVSYDSDSVAQEPLQKITLHDVTHQPLDDVIEIAPEQPAVCNDVILMTCRTIDEYDESRDVNNVDTGDEVIADVESHVTPNGDLVTSLRDDDVGIPRPSISTNHHEIPTAMNLVTNGHLPTMVTDHKTALSAPLTAAAAATENHVSVSNNNNADDEQPLQQSPERTTRVVDHTNRSVQSPRRNIYRTPSRRHNQPTTAATASRHQDQPTTAGGTVTAATTAAATLRSNNNNNNNSVISAGRGPRQFQQPITVDIVQRSAQPKPVEPTLFSHRYVISLDHQTPGGTAAMAPGHPLTPRGLVASRYGAAAGYGGARAAAAGGVRWRRQQTTYNLHLPLYATVTGETAGDGCCETARLTGRREKTCVEGRTTVAGHGGKSDDVPPLISARKQARTLVETCRVVELKFGANRPPTADRIFELRLGANRPPMTEPVGIKSSGGHGRHATDGSLNGADNNINGLVLPQLSPHRN